MKILVVDDAPDSRDCAAESLLAVGFIVEVADDGAEGYLAARAQRFDGFVLDMMMPVDAPTMLRRLLRDDAAIPPFVIVSSMSRSDVAERFGRRVPHLRKPYLPDALVALVRRVIGEP